MALFRKHSLNDHGNQGHSLTFLEGNTLVMLSWINVTYVAKAQRRINRIKIVMRTEAHSKTNEAKVTDFKPDPAIRKREIILHTKMLPQKQKKLQFFFA